MNFNNFKKHFVPKTNQILQQWNSWDEEKRNDFAHSRLGLENKVWCNTCKKETNREKADQKQERLKNALRNVADQTQRDQITKHETDKKLTDCGHEAKPVCNWLLHYIHTFFVYYETKDLENFNNPEKIQRYQFNEKRLLRERINQLRIDLNELGQDFANTFGEELRRISNQLDKIQNLNRQTISPELQNINQRLQEIANNINAAASNGTTMGSREKHSCYHCKKGSIEIYIPDDYTGKDYAIRAVCQKTACREAEKQLIKKQELIQQNQTYEQDYQSQGNQPEQNLNFTEDLKRIREKNYQNFKKG